MYKWRIEKDIPWHVEYILLSTSFKSYSELQSIHVLHSGHFELQGKTKQNKKIKLNAFLTITDK